MTLNRSIFGSVASMDWMTSFTSFTAIAKLQQQTDYSSGAAQRTLMSSFTTLLSAGEISDEAKPEVSPAGFEQGTSRSTLPPGPSFVFSAPELLIFRVMGSVIYFFYWHNGFVLHQAKFWITFFHVCCIPISSWGKLENEACCCCHSTIFFFSQHCLVFTMLHPSAHWWGVCNWLLCSFFMLIQLPLPSA